MAFQAKAKKKKFTQPSKANHVKLKEAEEDLGGPSPTELIALHFRGKGFNCTVHDNWINVYVNNKVPFDKIFNHSSGEPRISFQYSNKRIFWKIHGHIAKDEVGSIEDPKLLSKMELLVRVYLHGAIVLARELKNKLI